ncbi:three-helix bundle dimerization domain-containing protein [Corynebacterium uberis]|uniref:hypothetical protein n=1 Tax=Corynebacterium TaxID=1716 RepID=UPI001D0B7347|nr:MULTISPECIES: hypothetical protein [Corynebacterium]MCZ9309595.1 hypothetical protein [Corynebacterium sp. c6VSa_13]UDL73404.1 hypothetical protein LH391_10025 [Corynebacterium uberis]UDL75716.1 hypothetical protein LH393_10900 [Corynebacterium uberis]UDL77928.1 hypothetical protein LH394_10885 [Corynebacterium uberis]UDL80212.1 hypothetical protein LH392_11305 [Corynebacterium uberis]
MYSTHDALWSVREDLHAAFDATYAPQTIDAALDAAAANWHGTASPFSKIFIERDAREALSSGRVSAEAAAPLPSARQVAPQAAHHAATAA